MWLGLVLLLISIFLTTLVYLKVANQEKWDWHEGIIKAIRAHDQSNIDKEIILKNRKVVQ